MHSQKIAFLVNESSKNSIGSLSGHTQLWVLDQFRVSTFCFCFALFYFKGKMDQL